MSNFASAVYLRNFKSIQKLDLKDCKRINLLIGTPNTGKSNILEGISLTSDPRSYYTKIRHKNVRSFFTDNNRSLVITSTLNFGKKESVNIFFNKSTNQYNLLYAPIHQDSTGPFLERTIEESFPNENLFVIQEDLRVDSNNRSIPDITKFYKFKKFEFERIDNDYLNAPFGGNLINILLRSSDIRKTVSSFFEPYGLKLMLDSELENVFIVKELDGLLTRLPFQHTADTLQRIIFYQVAILSNIGSVILFEEPEAHSYPPYISLLADTIANSKENQFFIATHSPYLVSSLLKDVLPKDLAIYITYYESYETKAYRMTESDIQDVIDNDLDIFYNMNQFLPETK